uniref:Replication factor C subunit 3/5 n=1 Tax=Tetraselmis sp. GSL018 TaxID=582737 RepID=A0A061RXH8_9CHLO|mmetsp:Transcript_17022/g.40611  ORF Transcript_17022/g.40611 Transcript_17022/m.40611 type:complete len:357 (+) Transcript_17022:237-1307(+)|eukprot:CAMPEP_0177610328 /NCGR_PEP_ID=MMETSP0419_2-20121207/19703_1 /TAXON_ID=582737 /ORGANISM="Tetraselmis sp., Strain GSL018" /LENGTH=356 /DNA_ID=CAMNT_0019105591 /DNA_START=173 /DNA_END=1243 /DNA_ORIENTATION=-
MLWVDKYRPRTFDKLIIHKELGANIKQLVSDGDCPHMLFYGQPGVGKKTLIMCTLREMFGPSVEKLVVETKPWKIELPNRKLEIEMTTVSSNDHVEMNPSDVGNNDRYVVQEIIKEMARSRPVDVHGNRGFKVLVLNEVDKMTREAQAALRRTMEKYSTACRLIMVCNNASKVLEPVRSRCICVRVSAPTDEEVAQVLKHVAHGEKLAVPPAFAGRVVAEADRNLRRALLSLETSKVQQYPFRDDQQVQRPDYEMYIAEIASDVMAEQSPKRLYQVRGKVYELLANCIPPELVIRTLSRELIRKLDDEMKHKVAELAAQYEHRLQEGSKAIYHVEAFIAMFMRHYKEWMINMTDGF